MPGALMKILYVHSSANNLAGSEMVLLKIIDRLDRRFEPLVILPERGPFLDCLRAEGIPTRVVGLGPGVLLNPLSRVRCILNFYLAARQERPALIHTSSVTPVQYAWPAARILDVPLVCHVQAPYDEQTLRGSRTVEADRIVLVSRYLGDHFRFDSRLEGKLQVIYSGIQIPSVDRAEARAQIATELGLSAGVPLVGMVGQVIRRKGIDVLFRAVRSLAVELPELRVLVVGNEATDHGDELKRLASELGIEQQVVWVGFRDDVPRFMAAVDVLAVPSRSEALGLVAAEALAAGTPVVASRVGGLVEVVEHDQTGYLVEVEDHEGLADHLARLLGDPTLRAEMGRRGRSRIEEIFDPGRSADTLHGIYLELTRGAAASARRPSDGIPRS
jgi:glycosyltransferase involved in cell wall biosynthesis